MASKAKSKPFVGDHMMLAEILHKYVEDYKNQSQLPWNVRATINREEAWASDFKSTLDLTHWASYKTSHPDIELTIDKYKQYTKHKIRDILDEMNRRSTQNTVNNEEKELINDSDILVGTYSYNVGMPELLMVVELEGHTLVAYSLLYVLSIPHIRFEK
jgi:phenylalanyl-tRNA synthetase alpha subunit